MKPKKLLPIVAGTIVTIGLLVPVTYLMYQRLVYGGCNRHLESSLMGPNGLHEARVLLETCSNGSFITEPLAKGIA